LRVRRVRASLILLEIQEPVAIFVVRGVNIEPGVQSIMNLINVAHSIHIPIISACEIGIERVASEVLLLIGPGIAVEVPIIVSGIAWLELVEKLDAIGDAAAIAIRQVSSHLQVIRDQVVITVGIGRA
jgi:hypothetical protein